MSSIGASGQGLIYNSDANNTLQLQTNSITAFTIDSSQNITISNNITISGNVTSSATGPQSYSGNIVAASGTTSTSTTTGALVVSGSGGLGVGGNLYVGGNLSVGGNTTFVNTQTITTTDTVAAPAFNGNTFGNSGAYFTGASYTTTANLVPSANNAASVGTSTIQFNAMYSVNNYISNVLVPFSNATASFGTSSAMPLNDYAVNYNVANVILPIANTTASIGSAQRTFQNIYGVNFLGTSTTAKYADLAEMYHSDDYYSSGTVMVFGGDLEVTISKKSHDSKIAGVISTNPAFLMNDNFEQENWLPIALTGRVPCNVRGPVSKGDILVSSDEPGVAIKLDPLKYQIGCIIGKSLEIIVDDSVKKIEIAVGRY